MSQGLAALMDEATDYNDARNMAALVSGSGAAHVSI